MGKRQDQIETTRGKSYWRSLDELHNTDEYRKYLEDEFPERGSIPTLDRRQFVKLTAASAIMASLAGCRSLPQEKIIPYVVNPEDSIPGVSEYYSTCFTMGGYAYGVLAESRSGRPGKLEGHPADSATKGSSNAILQASLYDMYDPDRSKAVLKNKRDSNWATFENEIRNAMEGLEGSRIRILTGNVTSPSLASVVQKFLKKHPGSMWHQFEPVNNDQVYAGTQAAFGTQVEPVYAMDKADVVVSIDDDFMATGPGQIRYSLDFTSRRYIETPDPQLNRLYAIYSAPSATSAYADNSLALKPSDLEKFARDLGAAINGGAASGQHANWVKAIADDLMAHRGRCVVTAGAHLPSAVHAVVHTINSLLGAVGQTVTYLPKPNFAQANQVDSLKELSVAMNAGTVDVLFILGTNPVYSAPSGLEFHQGLEKVKTVVHMGLLFDETAAKSLWHLPEAHYLESWGDAKTFDGVTKIQQPLIAPLYDGRSIAEVVEMLGEGSRNGKSILAEVHGLSGDAWDQAIHDGVVGGASAPMTVTANASALTLTSGTSASEYELVVLPDPRIFDGSFSNNPWLQEIPNPFSSVVWDNTVHLSPADAKKLGVNFEDIVELTVGGQSVRGPVTLIPGQADGTVVVHMGYGRTKGGKIMLAESPDLPVTDKMGAPSVGFNVFPLMGEKTHGASVQVSKVSGKWLLAQVQTHFSMEGRDIIRSGTLEEFKARPDLSHHHGEHHEGTMYDQTAIDEQGQQQWAMTIDLSLCTGCNACTIACQAENNIPAVGKEQVARGREMHWIRIDRYNVGPEDKVEEILFQPVACQQCERAPCEPVCPVAATVHSKEGLNQMVYNRCVGTRYCSNNCPYKVRRFNYINYHDKVDKPTITLLNNPDVTVRGRGVMEKCTYCVQRINKARIKVKRMSSSLTAEEIAAIKKTDELGNKVTGPAPDAVAKVPEGMVQTACQQACPTKAIVFGDMADTKAAVFRTKNNLRSYLLLPEVNTAPRTSYLGKVRNANPALVSTNSASHEGEGH